MQNSRRTTPHVLPHVNDWVLQQITNAIKFLNDNRLFRNNNNNPCRRLPDSEIRLDLNTKVPE